jgi:hypothetical protein
MKLTNETIFTSSIVIGFAGLLYSYMGLHRRIKTTEENINLIMSTHISYMVVKDEHIEQIKTINKTLEAIALSTPFRGEGWQTKYIQNKIKRDMENWPTIEETQEKFEMLKESKFYDDEPSEEGV